MTAALLEGKPIARQIEAELAARVADHIAQAAPAPCLAAVLVGDDPASEVYVRNKRKACDRIGMKSRLDRLPASTSEDDLLRRVDELNRDGEVHGILVQLPLPRGIDATKVLDAVDPRKDVDCFHPQNVGLVAQGRPRFLPCTPFGVVQLLHRSGVTIAGKEVAIVGRSDIVGKPLAMMLSQRDSPLGPDAANATVTLCHTRTASLAEVTRRADILVAAIGKAKFITAEMVRPGAVVVDVGINRTESGLVGDVDFAAVAEVASRITPVPGGVGPLTIAMLMENTLRAATETR